MEEDRDTGIYHTNLFLGIRSGALEEDGSGLAPGGGGPLPEHSGQPYP